MGRGSCAPTPDAQACGSTGVLPEIDATLTRLGQRTPTAGNQTVTLFIWSVARLSGGNRAPSEWRLRSSGTRNTLTPKQSRPQHVPTHGIAYLPDKRSLVDLPIYISTELTM